MKMVDIYSANRILHFRIDCISRQILFINSLHYFIELLDPNIAIGDFLSDQEENTGIWQYEIERMEAILDEMESELSHGISVVVESDRNHNINFNDFTVDYLNGKFNFYGMGYNGNLIYDIKNDNLTYEGIKIIPCGGIISVINEIIAYGMSAYSGDFKASSQNENIKIIIIFMKNCDAEIKNVFNNIANRHKIEKIENNRLRFSCTKSSKVISDHNP